MQNLRIKNQPRKNMWARAGNSTVDLYANI